jgi:hypothetical protein
MGYDSKGILVLNLKYEHAISFINLVKFINYYQMPLSISSKWFVIASGEVNVNGSNLSVSKWNLTEELKPKTQLRIMWLDVRHCLITCWGNLFYVDWYLILFSPQINLKKNNMRQATCFKDALSILTVVIK